MSAISGLLFGEVVLVPFPFTDQLGSKKRPAVVVSSSSYGASRRDIVIMAITGQVRQPLGFGEAMLSDWQGAGLAKTSVFKPVFATIEQSLVIRSMGALSPRDMTTSQGVLAEVSATEWNRQRRSTLAPTGSGRRRANQLVALEGALAGRRIGVAKGKFFLPDNIDSSNAEVTALFNAG